MNASVLAVTFKFLTMEWFKIIFPLTVFERKIDGIIYLISGLNKTEVLKSPRKGLNQLQLLRFFPFLSFEIP